jgi:hypothetical protein
MSRGGRGGWRGGRLGGPGKIAGADVPWAWDPDLKLDYTPSQLYPVRDTYFWDPLMNGADTMLT